MLESSFLNDYKKSHVIITNDFAGELNFLQNTKNKENLRIFGYDIKKNEFANELKIHDAHEIISEAYITTSMDKYIAIFSYEYSRVVQNALLKILEEPPQRVYFIFFINSKNKLIPTIFSRLACFDKRVKMPIEPFPLDVTKLNIPLVYDYIKSLEMQNLSSENGRKILTSLLFSIANSGINLNDSDLARFDNAIKSLQVKQSVHLSLLPILLSLIRM